MPKEYKNPVQAEDLKKLDPIHALLNSEYFNTSIRISDNITVKPIELFLILFRYCLLHSLSSQGFLNLAKLINVLYAQEIIPANLYFLNKIFDSPVKVRLYAVCPQCKNYIGGIDKTKQKIVCRTCSQSVDLTSSKSNDFFVIIDPSNGIAKLINENHSYYDWVVKKRQHAGLIEDIYDGKRYRNFVTNSLHNKKNCYATLIMNTDGAEVFRRSQKSLWPTYLMLNELPASVRIKNMLTCGLCFGQKEINMSAYLGAFVDFFNDKLTKSGISCQINGEARQIFPCCLMCCVDTPARAKCQFLTNFNGSYGCTWCTHSGIVVNKTSYYPTLKRKFPPARNSADTLSAINKAVHLLKKRKKLSKHQKKMLKGITNKSPLCNLQGFDIIFGFRPDYIHNCLLGVGKRITERILEKLTPIEIAVLSDRMNDFRVPYQLAQTPRPLTKRHLWKAKEWEAWVLHYSLPILSSSDKIKQKYVDYWALFSTSLHTLLSNKITFQDVENVHKKLVTFATLTEVYFQTTEMTSNIHQLLHLANSVYDWGPLWAHSCFPFENANHLLVKSVNSANGVNTQIIRFLGMSACSEILEENLYPGLDENLRNYYEGFSKYKTDAYRGENAILYNMRDIVDNAELEFLENMGWKEYDVISFTKALKNGILFSTKNAITKKTDNSVGKMSDDSYIQINNFIVNKATNHVFILYKKIVTTANSVLSKNNEFLERITEVENDLKIASIKKLINICVITQVNKVKFISALPNTLLCNN